MAKIVVTVMLFGAASGLLPWCGTRGFALGYTIEQVTDTPGGVFAPAINNLGDIVYSWQIDGVFQVFLLTDDGELTQLTEGSGHHRFPRINDLGEIIWQHDVTGGPQTVESNKRGVIGDNQYDHTRGDINNDGEVIWTQYDYFEPGKTTPSGQVYSSVRGLAVPAKSLGDGPNESSGLGNTGEIVYRGERPAGESVFTDTGIYSTTRGVLLEETDEHVYLSVNIAGTVVWYGVDDEGVFQVYGLFDGEVQPLTTGPRDSRWPDINDAGEIVFLGKDLHAAFQVFKLTPTTEDNLPIDPMLVLHPEIRDSDDDGVPDVFDAFPDDPAYFADTDGDGVPDGQDGDRPLITAFVGNTLNRGITESDLRESTDEAQSGLIGARVSIPERSLDKAIIVTADVGDTASYFPGGHLVAGGREQLIVGWPLRLGPAGTDLAPAATVTVPFEVARLSEVVFGTLRVARIAEDGSISLLASADSGVGGTVTISPGHFSQFVVVGQTLSSGGGGGCVASSTGRIADDTSSLVLALLPLLVAAMARRRIDPGLKQ